MIYDPDCEPFKRKIFVMPTIMATYAQRRMLFDLKMKLGLPPKDISEFTRKSAMVEIKRLLRLYKANMKAKRRSFVKGGLPISRPHCDQRQIRMS